MKYIATTATHKILDMDKRIRLVAGGMRASKTISILLCLIDKSQTDKSPTLTSVVSETFPHLRKGAMRDFESIMEAQGYWKPSNWNVQNSIYTFETGSKIEFFSADSPDKIRGPSRDRLFVNEVNNIKQDAWEQLLYRTSQFAFADWNPVSDFYMYTEYGLDDEGELRSTDDRVDFIILTYKDNEALEPAIREDIIRKSELNPNFKRIYADGKRGNVEGKIFRNWKIIDAVPHEARLEVGGGDFGFARDKTAFCDIYKYNGGYIIDEIVSRVGLFDTDLAAILLNRPNPNLLYIVDSADEQKVLTLRQLGVTVTGVVKKGAKGVNFTNAAISFVQDQPISITKRSVNYIQSYRNFMWQTNKDSEVIPKYDHYFSDEMMSVVYGMTSFTPREGAKIQTSSGNITSLWRR